MVKTGVQQSASEI